MGCVIPPGEPFTPFTENFANNANAWWTLTERATIGGGLFIRYPTIPSFSTNASAVSTEVYVGQSTPSPNFDFEVLHNATVTFQAPASYDLGSTHVYTHEVFRNGFPTEFQLMAISVIYQPASPSGGQILLEAYSEGSGVNNRVSVTVDYAVPFGSPMSFELGSNNDSAWVIIGGSTVAAVDRETRLAFGEECGYYRLDLSTNSFQPDEMPLDQIYYQCNQADLETTGYN